jgi:hypothetical protein
MEILSTDLDLLIRRDMAKMIGVLTRTDMMKIGVLTQTDKMKMIGTVLHVLLRKCP